MYACFVRSRNSYPSLLSVETYSLISISMGLNEHCMASCQKIAILAKVRWNQNVRLRTAMQLASQTVALLTLLTIFGA